MISLPLIILAVGGALALIMLLVGIVISIRGEKDLVAERLGQIAEERRPTKEQKKQASPLTDWVNGQVEGSNVGERISKDLARADIKMKAGEYIALMAIAAVGVGFVFWFIGGSGVVRILIGMLGAIIGLFLPGFYVRREQGKRLRRFNDQLPDTLSLMVNGLRAGYSTMQAMESVSREMPSPICDEFKRVVQEMQLGVPMETALQNLLRRIPSDDLDLMITAVNVQREVGGNLAEIMDTISYTIRERIRIKGEIRVLTSQVMYSGRFLSLMPVFVIIILYLLNREYMSQFMINGACGYIPLGCSGLLIVVGYFVMNKIGDIEI